MPSSVQTRTGRVLPFAQIEPETIYDRVYRELRAALMQGQLEPGQGVTIRTLAQAFGTSAMPVREAIRRLVTEQALELLPNRTVRVPVMTRRYFEELVDVRLELEGDVSEKAAIRRTKTDLNAVREAHAALQNAMARRDIDAYLKANQQFHFGIYKASGSKVRLRMIEILWLQAGPLFTAIRDQEGPAAFLGEVNHRLAFEAFEAGDGPGTRTAITADISEGAYLFLQGSPGVKPMIFADDLGSDPVHDGDRSAGYRKLADSNA